jgi:hypothetical protein
MIGTHEKPAERRAVSSLPDARFGCGDMQPSQIAISGGRLGTASAACHPSATGSSNSSTWDAEDDEVEIVPNFAFDFERLEPCPPSVLHREIRPPTPRSEATVCAVTRGNITEPAATAFVALLTVLLSVRTIGYSGEQWSGGESVSQSLLKDKAFSTFLDQNLPFELPEKGISRSTKGCPAQWSVIDISAIKRLAKGKFRRTARPDRRQSRNLIVAHPGSGPALQFPSAVDVTKEPCADDLPTALRTAGRHVSHGCARSRLSMWPSELRIRR